MTSTYAIQIRSGAVHNAGPLEHRCQQAKCYNSQQKGQYCWPHHYARNQVIFPQPVKNVDNFNKNSAKV